MNYFVTAIGTDSGKTVVSAILAKALHADYWKPVQAGIEETDTDSIRALCGDHVAVHPEAYRLKAPMSPHAAAALENTSISLDQVTLPETTKNLVIEGAGGILVPLNDKEFVIDMAQKFDAEVVLVANLYLGSINHTLLSIQELKRRNVTVKGIVFNGAPNESSEEYILKYAGYCKLLHVMPEENLNESSISHYAQELKKNWHG